MTTVNENHYGHILKEKVKKNFLKLLRQITSLTHFKDLTQRFETAAVQHARNEKNCFRQICVALGVFLHTAVNE